MVNFGKMRLPISLHFLNDIWAVHAPPIWDVRSWFVIFMNGGQPKKLDWVVGSKFDSRPLRIPRALRQQFRVIWSEQKKSIPTLPQ